MRNTRVLHVEAEGIELSQPRLKGHQGLTRINGDAELARRESRKEAQTQTDRSNVATGSASQRAVTSSGPQRVTCDRPPTLRQLEVLAAIADHLRINRWPPTYAELLKALGLVSKNGIADHLDLLERKGLLERGHGARALAITPLGEKHLKAFRPAATAAAGGAR